jgi:hypothetical protein
MSTTAEFGESVMANISCNVENNRKRFEQQQVLAAWLKEDSSRTMNDAAAPTMDPIDLDGNDDIRSLFIGSMELVPAAVAAAAAVTSQSADCGNGGGPKAGCILAFKCEIRPQEIMSTLGVKRSVNANVMVVDLTKSCHHFATIPTERVGRLQVIKGAVQYVTQDADQLDAIMGTVNDVIKR